MTFTKRHVYLGGALGARAFLRRAQAYVHEFGQHRSRLLQQQLILYTGTAYSPALACRFVDMIGTYLSLTLEHSDIDPATWGLMAEVRRLRQVLYGGMGDQLPRIRHAARSPHHTTSSKTGQLDKFTYV